MRDLYEIQNEIESCEEMLKVCDAARPEALDPQTRAAWRAKYQHRIEVLRRDLAARTGGDPCMP